MSAPFNSDPSADVADVLGRFDGVLAWARQHNSRLGYFAALYRGVTLGARRALARDGFENPQAAERLVVLFANRYFEALGHHFAGLPVMRSWQVAFDAAKRWSPTVSQHLLLGVNAHINLDLGIAVAQTLAERELPRSDFGRVNELLLQMIDEVEEKLAEVWPLLRLLDWLSGRLDEALVGAGLLRTRAKAWEFAQSLRAPGADQETLVTAKDQRVAEIGRRIARPRPLLRMALGAVRLGELRSVVEVIDLLAAQTAEAPSAKAEISHRTPPA